MSAPRFAVILAGGVGSRFWPLSTPTHPKQLLPLVGDKTMLEETVARLAPLVGHERILILTSRALGGPIRVLLPQLQATQILEEPRAAGTAAALTWASLEVRRLGGADAVLISVHADSAIGDDESFRRTLAAAADAAEQDRALCLVGIVPSAPDPGLGYIEPGETQPSGARSVARFIEKPERARAATLVAAGCLWNSGIFAWRAEDFLTEVRAHAPEVGSAIDAAGTAGADAFFAAVRGTVSVDVGVLERSNRVIVVPGAFSWSDVGTWGALRGVRPRDASGNTAHGAVSLVDAHDNVVHSAQGRVVLYGVHDLVVVVRDGVTLVTTVEHSANLKVMLDALPADLVRTP